MNIKMRYNSSGFTLIEITIVIVIASIILAAALSIVRPYFAQQQIERTASAVRTVDRALAEFLEENGRYPCPAPLNTPRGDALDGIEDCTPDNIGVRTVEGYRHQGTATLQAMANEVYIGAIPYRTLDVPVSSTIDAAANRLTYAVSKASTSNDPVTGYEDNLSDLTSSAAVLIVDESNTSISQRDIDPSSPGQEQLAKHYFFFSHGQLGAGSFTDNGVANGLGCDTTSRDGENCDFANGRFIAAARSLGTNPEFNDDISNESLNIEADLNESLWARTPSDEKNIYNLNDNNVGVGTDDPTHHFHVSGGADLGAFPMNANNGVFKIEEDLAGIGPAPSMVFDGNQVLASHGLMLSTAATASNATNAQNFLALGTNNLERFRITFDGNIGIGTDSPNGSTGLVSNMKVNSVFSADRLVDIDLPGWTSQQDIQVRVGDLVLNSRNNGSNSIESVKDRGANGNLVVGAVGSIVFNLQEKDPSQQDDMEMALTLDGLGIGTNNPMMPLHVHSPGNATAIISGYGDIETYSSLTLDSGDGNWLTNSWVFAFKKQVGNVGNSGLQLRHMVALGKDFTSIFFSDTGNISVGHVLPQVKLDVAGEIKLGYTGMACEAKLEGAQRYNAKIKNMEFCDGVIWRPFGTISAKGPISCYGSQGPIPCGNDYGCKSVNDHAECPAGHIQVGMDICGEQKLGLMCQKL